MSELTAAAFGSEPAEPYARALRAETGSLRLHAVGDAAHTLLDVARFLGDPDAAETRIARMLHGPVLDVGCGPGRMVRASLDAGRPALGLDVSPAAVQIAQTRGLPVVHGSIFDTVPGHGTWRSVLLLDGNIGIGGDPAALLARCAQIMHTTGHLLVETHPDRARDRVFEGVLANEEGDVSAPFPWAEVGRRALRRHARGADLEPVGQFRSGARHFARYAHRGMSAAGDPGRGAEAEVSGEAVA